MTDPSSLCWIDGRVRSRALPALRVDDSAYAEGRGCYTSVRIQAGRPRFETRHLRRLERGARALGLGHFDHASARRALHELAELAFPAGEGIVRVQLSREGGGGARIVGIPRGLGPDRLTWRAITAPIAHEGPILVGGHKLTNRLLHALASDAAAEAGADEALLFDRAGRLVEAARSNVMVVDGDGRLCTPPLERGAVGGIAREILMERIPELATRDLSARDLRGARAILCSNAVRGIRPLESLDGMAVPGADHPWVERLVAAFAIDEDRAPRQRSMG